jgi:hypothetical protein
MNIPIEVSPNKFSTIPEEIKARIIRRGGTGTVNTENLLSSIE